MYLECGYLGHNKNIQLSLKSIFLAEMLLRSTLEKGTALAEMCYSIPALPNETSYFTKTHCYSNCHLCCGIRQEQPKFHQKLTFLNARALSATSESRKLAGSRSISFPSLTSCPCTDLTDGK